MAAVALIVAAGLGERLGADRPKALVPLAGRPLLQWSLDVLASLPEIERIVVALPQGTVQAPAGASLPPGMAQAPIGVSLPANADCIEGGAARSESVRRGLAWAGAAGVSDLVLVHDAARPLVRAELVQATLAAAARAGVDGVVAAAPVTDTIKQADEHGFVLRTLDRAGLWAVQTPQVFRRSALERALDVPDDVLAQATDDAWLLERVGGSVAIVPSSAENLKVTTPVDLQLAELILAQRSAVPVPSAATDAGAGGERGDGSGERGGSSPA